MRPRVTGVVTDQGDVEAERVVLCCGLWTRDLAASVGAVVPLYAAEHVHVTTAPIEGATPDLPLLRDLDGSLYIRHNRGALMVGAFEPQGQAARDVHHRGRASPSVSSSRTGSTSPRSGRRRSGPCPSCARSTYERFLCAPESFTPDVNFCLGETPEVAGLFVGAGFNSQGIIYAPGAGRALADWVIEGSAGFDASGVDVARFATAQGNRRYLHERTRESLGRLYAMHWPHVQSHAARGRTAHAAHGPARCRGRTPRRDQRVGAPALVRPARRPGGADVLLPSTQLVRAGRRGAPSGPRGRGVLRPLVVRDLRRRRARRARRAPAPLHR